ncbi:MULTISPECIES: molecular chaperone [Enterobacter]|uniref:fimbrial biogenesis chaperone n=1 Tax=Enterobacter TaxID=547 RepID=UPI001F44C8AA|nr:fimbria/pilus periplasmic chaperone [Enterobacter quasiroggenkampii]
MMNKYRYLPLALLLIVFSLLTMPTHANVVIAGTRVIYPVGEREVTIRLDNRGELPALVQAWVDDGNKDTPVSLLKVPFVITPVISRIEAHNGQTLRLSYTGASTLPKDKESVFWLNVLDIPPQAAKQQDTNRLQMALRSRIKIFVRPETLDADGAAQAINTLRWNTTREGLEAINSSPYYVNIASVVINEGKRKISATDGAMIAPGQTHLFTLIASDGRVSSDAKITYTAINDFGGETTQQVNIH